MGCTNVSLNQIVNQYMPERTRAGSKTSYADLKSVKDKITDMYSFRNKDYVESRNNGNETICHQHYYTSYADFLEKTGRPANSLSVGDLYDATNQIAYCTCDGRHISKCPCVVVKDNTATCSCYTRNPIQCDCVGRSAGKYNPTCYCDCRYTECNCVSRSAQYTCDCNGRCQCNAVSEYTMEPKNTTAKCDCVSRTYQGACECHVHNVKIEACTCQNRSYTNVSNAPHGWDGYCGGGHMMKQVGRCENNTGTEVSSACTCVERQGSVLCQCNIRNFYGAVI